MKNLIFIHGAGNEGDIWRYVKPYLQGSCKIHTPDLPGHGKTDGTATSIDGYADWVLEYIKKNRLSDVVLIGHSMGGAICIKCAKDESISALIVVDSGLKLPVSPKIINGLKEDLQKTIKTIAKWSFSKSAPENMINDAVKMMLDNKKAILNDFLACSSYSGYEAANDINIPSTVIVGDSDVMTPIELAEETAYALKANLITIENAGHMVQIENPKMLAQKILYFLKNIK